MITSRLCDCGRPVYDAVIELNLSVLDRKREIIDAHRFCGVTEVRWQLAACLDCYNQARAS